MSAALQGRDGLLIDLTDHSGRWLSSVRRAEPAAGADLRLTIDARLQRLVEERLDRALALADRAEAIINSTAGGAVVMMDARSGAILALATAPRFNPNAFASRDTAVVERLLADPAHPLFDRATKMAIPPGSVFKVVTALALTADPGFDPLATCDCQGYLTRPDRERCQIFRRYGVGHGETDLTTALRAVATSISFSTPRILGPRRWPIGHCGWASGAPPAATSRARRRASSHTRCRRAPASPPGNWPTPRPLRSAKAG